MLGLFRRLEFVADFSDGMNKGWSMRVGFDFVAQGCDETVDATLADEAIVAPDGIQNLVAGQRPPGLFNE